MSRRVACVFGGSGFIGRQIVRRLAAQGFRVRAAVRDTEAAHFLKPMGDVGQVVPIKIDITDQRRVAAAVEGCEVVVNAVGVLVESGRQNFSSIHAVGAANVAEGARAAGAETFLLVSSLAADPASPSAYGRSKAESETRTRFSFPDAIVLRPSVVYGQDDSFFNRFAAMTTFGPFLPVVGTKKFQPVFVDDVGDAAEVALGNPESRGKTYLLGGPGTYTMHEMLSLMLESMGRKRRLIQIPMGLASLMAVFAQLAPGKPLTPDQVRQLESDNVVPAGALGFAALGLTPEPLEAILPQVMSRFRNQYIHAFPAA